MNEDNEEPVSSYSEEGSHSSDQDNDHDSNSSFESEEAEDEMEEPSEQKSLANNATKSTDSGSEYFSSLHVFGLNTAKDIK